MHHALSILAVVCVIAHSGPSLAQTPEITVPREGQPVYEDEFAEYYAIIPPEADGSTWVSAYSRAIKTLGEGRHSNLTVGDEEYRSSGQIIVFGEQIRVSPNCRGGPVFTKDSFWIHSSLAQGAPGMPGVDNVGRFLLGPPLRDKNPTLANPESELYRVLGPLLCDYVAK